MPEDNIGGDIPAEVIKVDQEKVRNDNIDEDNLIQGNQNNLEESSDDLESVGSEFVEDTQQHFSPTKSQHQSATTDAIPTLARVAKDMDFLKKSWANLADLELEDEINNEIQQQNANQNSHLSDQPEDVTPEVPFQLVTHKKSKKATTSSHQTYQTRSKVDNLNLGK